MKSALIFLAFLSFIGCSSVDMLTIEQSQKLIDKYIPQIEQNDKLINSKQLNLPTGKDVILSLGIQPLNIMMQSLATNRTDDINLYFGYSPNIIKEEKSIVGIKYVNFVNVDSGFVYLDLKSLKIDRFEKNKLFATIEIEGFGKVSVSGKFAGIPASISPDVQLYLIEPINFELLADKPGSITMKPMPKKMILKTKLKINLLGWDVPWYQEVPLEFSDLVRPMQFPIALKSEIQFPLPASKFGDNKIEYVPYLLKLKNSSVSGTGTRIIYKTDIDFIKK